MKKVYEFYIKRSVLLIFLLTIGSCAAQKKITAKDLLNVTEKDLMEIDSLNQIYIYAHDKVNTPKVKSLKEFGEFIWYRKKNGEIRFHKKNLKIIAKEYLKGNSKYFSSLKLYRLYIIFTYSENHQNYLSFAERAYIAAHLTEHLYICQNKINNSLNSDFIGILLWTRKNYRNRFNREFENYNYYGLKLLKKHYLQKYKPNTYDSHDLYYQKYIKREELSRPNRVF